MELSAQEFYQRLTKAKASKELEYRAKERDILEDQANTTKPTGKYIRDPMNSLTMQQTVAAALGYPKDQYGAYEYPTQDEPERYYEFTTALLAEKHKRTLHEVKRCLTDIRNGSLGLLEHKVVDHISGLKVWKIIHHRVEPRLLVQNLLLALCDLDPIPPAYQKAVLNILDSIPDTKPETPQEKLDREAKNAPPIPWRSEPSTLGLINKIKKLIEVENIMVHTPWPTKDEYIQELSNRKAQEAQIAQTKLVMPSNPPGSIDLTDAQIQEYLEWKKTRGYPTSF